MRQTDGRHDENSPRGPDDVSYHHGAHHHHRGPKNRRGGWISWWWWRLRHRVSHTHDAAEKVDSALESSRAGLRTTWLSLVGLAVTAAAQMAVFAVSGSVALLGDTLHNAADALTSVPLLFAFLLGRRAATRAYTYGFGRAEDMAGIFIVAVIAASAVAAGWTAFDRLLHAEQVHHLPYVALAGAVGFVGNEWVARYRIRTGRQIGSAALVADGLHARTDGFTSLAVILAAGGAWAGWAWADPVVGLGIAAAIAFVLRDAAAQVYRRLMDAVDPALVDRVETTLRHVSGVRDVASIRLRWVGHRLHAETDIVVDADLSLVAAHDIAAEATRRLHRDMSRLATATVHTDPHTHPGPQHHVAAHR